MHWIKDNGQSIETNDLPATIEYCESLGWGRAEDDDITHQDIEKIAKQCHDANRKHLKTNGDDSLPIWSKTEDHYKEGIIGIVKLLMENPGENLDFGVKDQIIISTAKAGIAKLVK